MSKNREIDAFLNDTLVSVKDDVVMVKTDVKPLITSIFSQLQVNYSKFRHEDINFLPNTRYNWKGRHIIYLLTLTHSIIVRLLSHKKKHNFGQILRLMTLLARPGELQNTNLKLLVFTKIY